MNTVTSKPINKGSSEGSDMCLDSTGCSQVPLIRGPLNLEECGGGHLHSADEVSKAHRINKVPKAGWPVKEGAEVPSQGSLLSTRPSARKDAWGGSTFVGAQELSSQREWGAWDSPGLLELRCRLRKQVWGDPAANSLSFRAPGSMHANTQGLPAMATS